MEILSLISSVLEKTLTVSSFRNSPKQEPKVFMSNKLNMKHSGDVLHKV